MKKRICTCVGISVCVCGLSYSGVILSLLANSQLGFDSPFKFFLTLSNTKSILVIRKGFISYAI